MFSFVFTKEGEHWEKRRPTPSRHKQQRREGKESEKRRPFDDDDGFGPSDKITSESIPQEVKMLLHGLEFDYGVQRNSEAPVSWKNLGLGRYKVIRAPNVESDDELEESAYVSNTMPGGACKSVTDARSVGFLTALKQKLPDMGEKKLETDEDKIIIMRRGKWGAYKFMWR